MVPAASSLRFGVIADCQYADVPTEGMREFRLSARKLSECVEHLNRLDLDFVLQLGDLIDRDERGFQVVRPILESLRADCFQVLGNHDYVVRDGQQDRVPGWIGLSQNHYQFTRGGWRFVVLDGNEISLHAHPTASPERVAAERYRATLDPEPPAWNGAVSGRQLDWLDQALTGTDARGEPVIICCHFPVHPENRHNLWNALAVRDCLASHASVKAYLAGHDHDGQLGEFQGLQFLTLKGMVDTRENAYSVITLEEGRLQVTGFGREPDRVLRLRSHAPGE